MDKNWEYTIGYPQNPIIKSMIQWKELVLYGSSPPRKSEVEENVYANNWE
jgi:hypothetical protein